MISERLHVTHCCCYDIAHDDINDNVDATSKAAGVRVTINVSWAMFLCPSYISIRMTSFKLVLSENLSSNAPNFHTSLSQNPITL